MGARASVNVREDAGTNLAGRAVLARSGMADRCWHWCTGLKILIYKENDEHQVHPTG